MDAPQGVELTSPNQSSGLATLSSYISGSVRSFGFPQLSFGLLGDHTGEVTPVPIPNTVVKPSKADGTVRAT